jgi:ribosome biogenesis GTPase
MQLTGPIPMTLENLLPIGWKPFFQQQLRDDLPLDASVARVAAHYGSQILLLGEDGEFSIPVLLAESAGEIAVGDWLVLDQDARAVQRLERQTMLSRRPPGKESKPQLIAANVDTMFIVSSCNQDFNLSRIERYLALTLQSGATPVVVLTKSDLCETATDLRREAEKLHPGLLVETLDARDQEQAEVLKTWCRPGQSVALLGSSGVGKSTLANTLGAKNLSTAGIREKDGRGRHTTTARSLHHLVGGGVLLDTPGMRELQLLDCEDGVADLFDDVFQIASGCRFNDCSHDGDTGCAVAAALESGELDERRFVSFKKLVAEQAHNARSLAERRKRDRGFGRMYKSVINEKRRRRGGC